MRQKLSGSSPIDANGADLFGGATPPADDDTAGDRDAGTDATRPLADRQRPRTLDDVVGQPHLLGPDGALRRMLARGSLASLILWGGPGRRQDDDRAPARPGGGSALRPALGGVLGRGRPQARLRRGGPAAPRGSGRHAAVRRRDPPLQPRAAGRLPAGGRGRHRRAGGSDHGESLLRIKRGAAVALPGAGAAAARRRRPAGAHGARRAGCRPCAAAHAGRTRDAARDGGWRRALPAEHGGSSCSACPGRTRSIRRRWPTCWHAGRRCTTRTARSTTT